MRGIAFVAMILLGLFTPWWLFIVCALGYLWFWSGGELFVIALLLDIHFGMGGFFSGAFYTLCLAIAYIIIATIKPNLIFES